MFTSFLLNLLCLIKTSNCSLPMIPCAWRLTADCMIIHRLLWANVGSCNPIVIDLGTSTCILYQTLLQRSTLACVFVFLPLGFSLLYEGSGPLALGLCDFSDLPSSGSRGCCVPSSSGKTPNEKQAQASGLRALSTLFSSALPPRPRGGH